MEAAESLEFPRMVVEQLLWQTPTTVLREPSLRISTTWHVDAKSLFDVVTKDVTGGMSDKRARVVIAQLRELRMEQLVHKAWVDGDLMLADRLTKNTISPEYMKEALQLNHWSSRSTPEDHEKEGSPPGTATSKKAPAEGVMQFQKVKYSPRMGLRMAAVTR